ncbi:glycosyltransferase family 4 protein [Paenarthrobacter ureafaciens]|uniref:glycosyltransferase family 4 protein n=1 Tax=Paenarthrobacter ureafaciens TaxID=37931 RepID=UPI00398AAEFC
MTQERGIDLQQTECRKVAIVVSHLAPAFGMERVALQTAALLGANYEVEVVCIGGSQSDRELYPEARILGGPLRGWRRVTSLWRLLKFSGQLETDVVLLTGVWVALPWLMVVRRNRFAVLVWEHSLLSKRVASSLQMRVLACGARLFYRRSDAVVAVSEPLRRDIAAITRSSQVVTIPNFVETPGDTHLPLSRPRVRGDSIRLITVGSLTAIKSQEIVIRALSLLEDKYTLTIVGAGPCEANLRELSRSLGLGPRIRFAGFLGPDELKHEMISADLMVHCAVVETFGLVYVEAANHGLPVISTSNDVAEEMIPAFVPGWTCAASPSGVAEEIEARASVKIDKALIYKSAQRRRDTFGSNSVASKWAELFSALTSPARSL